MLVKFAQFVGLALVLDGCAAPIGGCRPGLSGMAEAQLFFGDQIPGGGAVSNPQWQQFVDSEVTPRFPDGFTVLATTGQWRRPDGMIAREAGHELVIIFAPNATSGEKLDQIRAAYKQRFMQESVLLAELPSSCAGF